MHVLITGHTGFKGTWLTFLLRSRGHTVSGFSLDPIDGALFTRADAGLDLQHDIRADVRDARAVADALALTSPDAVIHLAAQPLVRASFADPRTTIETNVMGTLNVLEAVGSTESVRAQLIVTTDKVYLNTNQIWAYREPDPLGGDDPYSASKAMVEIMTRAWTHSFPGCPTVTARAGNVIGGGDVSSDRLLPDLIAAMADGRATLIRNPDAVRPWQHVLDAVNGYVVLTEALLAGAVQEPAWNFGPESTSFLTVGEVADRIVALWGAGASWEQDGAAHPPEANQLTLDSRRSTVRLGWTPMLDIDAALGWSVDWAKRVHGGEAAAAVTRSQVSDFELRYQARADQQSSTDS